MPQTPVTIMNNQSLNPNANNTGGINWVAGLNGAKIWKMYPNTMDILMDSLNEGIYYIKTSDNVGMTAALRAFKYSEISLDEVPMQDANTPQQIAPTNFVTKDDFNSFKSEILDAIRNNSNGHYNKNKKPYNNGGDRIDGANR